jgi:hypothetical protein
MKSVRCISGVLLAAGTAAAQQSVSINLAGLQIRNATNQSRTSAPNTISPAFRYHHQISGTVHGVGGVLGTLYPNPTSLATVMEALAPGSSANLTGDDDNCSGTHPIVVPPFTQSGSQQILGITVNYGLTLTFGIDASNVASFSLTNVTLTPSILTGYLQFDTGTAMLTRVYVCPANCDGSTTPPILTVNDFVCFMTKFAAGDTGANCDCSTSAPILNVADFVCFQTRFANGCAPP